MSDYITRNNIDIEEDDDESTATETSGESCDFDCDEYDESSNKKNIEFEGDTVISDDIDTSDSIEETTPNSTDDSDFTDGHEARMFTKMVKRTEWVVPMMFYDGESLCNMNYLQLGHSDVDPIAQEFREEYAKIALMMFYPFRNKNDLLLNNSHWDLFKRELNKHNNNKTTLFWPKGFEILQNIENRRNLQHNIEKREDAVTRNTRNRLPTAKVRPFENNKDAQDMGGIIPFLDNEDEDEEQEQDTMTDIQLANLDSTHDKIISNCNFEDSHFICPNFIDSNESRQTPFPRNATRRDFNTLLEIFKGAAGGFATYRDYLNSSSTENQANTQNEQNITIAGVAQDLAKTHNRQLDEKQYITYDMICCSFLLAQLDETGECNSIINNYITEALGESTGSSLSSNQQCNLNTVKKLLKSRGREEQLRLFLTGPAGAGKTTAIKAAETFCFRFSMHVGITWTDTTFFYTAYTGSAASAFGGRTIVKASGMWSKGVSEEQRNDWRNCKILVIDEISFMKESELMQLDNKLKILGDRNKIFGGYSIIFGGDFRQLTKASKKQLMYSKDSSQFFEHNLTGTIILQNEHRFKNDKVFGKLLSDFWSGDLSDEQRKLINERVIGTNGLQPPDHLENDATYACPTNKERNSISAGIFKKIINANNPDRETDIMPPSKTIIIESTFGVSASKNGPVRRIKNTLRHRILTTCGDADIEYGNNK
eukprot:scaffold87347_cov52-Cyclotella_meneghiniana.AAC.2